MRVLFSKSDAVDQFLACELAAALIEDLKRSPFVWVVRDGYESLVT